MSVSQTAQERIVDGLSATPFLSLFSYHFMTLNQFLETVTLLIGLLSGLFSLFFHAHRWYRARKASKNLAVAPADDTQ